MPKHQQEPTQRQPAPQISFESLLFGESPPDQNPTDSRESPSLFTPEDFPRAPEPGDEIAALTLPERPQGEGEPLQKTDLARQKVEEGIAALAAELEAGHSEALVRWLEVMSRFHTYSLNNTLLIAWQRPQATLVAGFHTWKEQGRTVKKGEKGILILAPIPKRTRKAENPDEDDEAAAAPARKEVALRGEVWGFRVVHVFDIEQTEGKGLPEFAQVQGDPAEYLEKLRSLIRAEGITLEYVQGLQGASGVSLGGTIKVIEGLTPAHEFSVLTHELAHELLHKDPRRRADTTKTIRETEAEAIAFVVCRAIGLETSQQHSDYIKLYQGDTEILAASLEAIREISARILGAIEERKAPERRNMGESQKRPQKGKRR